MEGANSNSQFGFRLVDSGANNVFTDNNCLTNDAGGSSLAHALLNPGIKQ